MKDSDEQYDKMMQEHLDNAHDQVKIVVKTRRYPHPIKLSKYQATDGKLFVNKQDAIQYQYDLNRGAIHESK